VIRTSARDQLRAYLESKGVASGIHYPVPIHLQDAYREYCPGEAPLLPVTERVTGEILSLPIYPELGLDELDYICDCVRKFAGSMSGEARSTV